MCDVVFDCVDAVREAITTDKHHRMSYSIGGVIANLAYNGDEFWGDIRPSRHARVHGVYTSVCVISVCVLMGP